MVIKVLNQIKPLIYSKLGRDVGRNKIASYITQAIVGSRSTDGHNIPISVITVAGKQSKDSMLIHGILIDGQLATHFSVREHKTEYKIVLVGTTRDERFDLTVGVI